MATCKQLSTLFIASVLVCLSIGENTTYLLGQSLNVTCGDGANDTKMGLCSNDTENNTTADDFVSTTASPPKSPFANAMVSKATYEEFSDISRNVRIMLLVIGSFVNSLNVYVYSRADMRNSISMYLAALGVCGAGHLSLGLPGAILSLIKSVPADLYTQLSAYNDIYINFFARTTFKNIYYCIACAVAVERFFAIAFPLRFRRINSKRVSKIAISVIACITISVGIPALFHWKAVPDTNPITNITIYVLKSSTYNIDNPEFFRVFNLGSKVIGVFIPIIGIILSDIGIILVLFLSRINLVTSSKDAAGQRLTNVVLVCTMFIGLFALPINIVTEIGKVHPTIGFFKKEHYFFLMLLSSGSLCDIIGFCLDFVVYISMSTSYRTRLMGAICKRRSNSLVRANTFASSLSGPSTQM